MITKVCGRITQIDAEDAPKFVRFLREHGADHLQLDFANPADRVWHTPRVNVQWYDNPVCPVDMSEFPTYQ